MKVRDRLQKMLHGVLEPVVSMFISLGLSPNIVTTIGVVLNLGVAGILILGTEEGHRGDLSYVGWSGALILFAGLFDMIDGQVARRGQMATRFGALYDSVMDRYSELVMFLGICYFLVAHHYFISSMIAFVALIGSMMVSYTRARAEGLGIPCKDGLMQRPERVVIIGLSALLCGIVAHYYGGASKWMVAGVPHGGFEAISVFVLPLSAVAVLANVTAFQRLHFCYRFLEKQQSEKNTNLHEILPGS